MTMKNQDKVRRRLGKYLVSGRAEKGKTPSILPEQISRELVVQLILLK